MSGDGAALLWVQASDVQREGQHALEIRRDKSEL